MSIRGLPKNPFQDLDVDHETGGLIYGWVFLAVAALVFAGIFAFLVSIARTPVVQDILPGKDYFFRALVTHVNLSFIIWFLTFMSALWVLSSTLFLHVKVYSPKLGWLGFALSAVGTVSLVMPALVGQGTPVLANYVPVLTHPLFYAGLILFASGILITLINTLLTVGRAVRGRTYSAPFPLVSYGLTLSGITVLIAFLCFGLAYFFLSGDPTERLYFERLFWGGGHILQFSNTSAMVTVWVLLVYLVLRAPLPFTDRIAKGFLGIILLFALPAPLFFFVYDIHGQAFKDGFTLLMRYGLGLTTGLFMLAIGLALWTYSKDGSDGKMRRMPWGDPGFSSLVLSMLLFIIGGIISLKIHGSNVKIPSHYHGVIGAVTIAFMGLTYHLLPLLKREIRSIKMAQVQPYVYGIGQILFVLGMFWAGTEGVPRKTFGSAQVLTNYAQYAGMAIMGLGGLVAILGGIFFVINVLLSLLKGKKENVVGAHMETLRPTRSV